MTEFCQCCHQSNCRVPHTYWVNGVELTDDYCGLCGVNWGVRKKKEIPPTRASAKALMKLFDKRTGRRV
jgi:hypothetical protein